MAEERIEITPAMQNPQYEGVVTLNAVHDDVFSGGKASIARSEVLLAGTSDARKIADHQKAVGNRVDEAFGDLDASAFFRDVQPDVVKIGFNLRGNPMGHFSGGPYSIRPEAAPDRVP